MTDTCNHPEVVPVTGATPDEVLGVLCTTCDAQLTTADWLDNWGK